MLFMHLGRILHILKSFFSGGILARLKGDNHIMNLKGLASLGLLTGLAAASQALTFDFGFVVTGSGNATPQPALRATITQNGLNSVNISIKNLAISGNQTVKTLYLNMDPFQLATVSNVGPSIDGISLASNGFNDAGYSFDVKVEFNTSGGGRLAPQATTSFDLAGTGLLESHFNALTPSTNGNPPQLLAMAHIISTPNGESVKLGAVPEPATMAGLAVGALALVRRRRK